MRTYTNPARSKFQKISQRPTLESTDIQPLIENIFNQVQIHGDASLIEFTKKFDGAIIDQLSIKKSELDDAISEISDDLLLALQQAKNNIQQFHEAQITEDITVEIDNGISLQQRSVPIQKVGIYIPGGTAPLLSTILMLGIPAKLAKCKEIILCTPPSNNGKIDKSMLATAAFLGIRSVFQVGGAQAIAAMTFGTETIPKVDKIFGPGNQYVTAAKQYAQSFGVAIDMQAGPSELLIYADETSVPAFIAADLLSQAEHGIDSQVVLVSTSQTISKKVILEIKKQVKSLPRKKITEIALENTIIVDIDDQFKAFEFINQYAPEHLIIASTKAEQYIFLVTNAGSVFIGNYCPESAGDYASGTNHTLPTNGWSKSCSGVNMDAFMKKITFQKIDKIGLQSLAKTITTMARAEKLEAHARAVEVRFSTQIKGN